ncbi:MAG: hypothetical protein WD066_02700 [Planctomycetaceae bacterium]
MSASVHLRRSRSDRRSVRRATFVRCCVPWLALLAGACEKPAADSSVANETPAAAADTSPPANPLPKTGGAESKPAGQTTRRSQVPTANPGKVPFTISKETTYVTEPLRADGLPDYAAALDAMAGEGVTPENNAVVSYWRAIGPRAIDPSLRSDYFAKLEMEVPPEKGEYLVGLKVFAEELAARRGASPHEQSAVIEQVRNQQERAARAPWRETDLPWIAEWLRRNEKPLRLVEEGTRRPHYFAPTIIPQTKEGEPPAPMIEALLPLLLEVRDMSRLLAVRAMLRLAEGRPEECTADLLTCRRLGRQVAHGWTFIDQLVGFAIEEIAMEGEKALAGHSGLSASDALRHIAELDRIPATRGIVSALDGGERFIFLSIICHTSLYGLGMFADEDGDASLGESPLNQALTGGAIEWDVPLKMGNELCDELAAVAGAAHYGDRQRLLADFESRFNRKQAELNDTESVRARMARDASETVGELLVLLLAPATRSAVAAEDRSRMQLDLSRLAFALAAYHSERGEYPAALAALAPKYLSAVSEDIFSGGSLIYRRTADRRGCVLYSVGPNGADDGGMLPEEGPFSDDLVVRMSPSARE